MKIQAKLFSALLVGLYENDEFHFVTPVGTGFNSNIQKDILQKLKPLRNKVVSFRRRTRIQ